MFHKTQAKIYDSPIAQKHNGISLKCSLFLHETSYSLSSAKEEHVVENHARKDLMWLRKLQKYVRLEKTNPTI